MNFDLKNMETYHYFIAGGGGLVIVAILLYFLKGKKLKVSAFVATTVGCLVVGFGAGILTLAGMGYQWTEQPKEESASPKGARMDSTTPKKQEGGGSKKNITPAASAKLQLAALVVKLNQLSEKPLSINLEDRQAKIAEQLKDLDTLETLTEDDAKARLKAMTVLLKSDQATLDATGLDLNRAGTVGKGKEPPPNPFTNDPNKSALKALQERVSKK